MALERSFSELCRRHEILRTSFPSVLGCPVQLVHPHEGFELPVVELSGLSAEERWSQALERVHQEVSRPFDPAHRARFRAQLLRLAKNEHVLVWVIHGIASGSGSAEVLRGELGALYGAFTAGRPSPLSEPEAQYGDFAFGQLRALHERQYAEQLAYWSEQLAGSQQEMALPTTRKAPSEPRFSVRRDSVHLDVELSQKLRALSHQQAVPLAVTLLAGYQLLLHRYSGQNELRVGCPISNRDREGVETRVGPLASHLVVRGDLAGDPRFDELLSRVQAAMRGALEHQDLPFEHLIEELRPERYPHRAAMFQVGFSLLGSPERPWDLAGLSCRRLAASSPAECDLSLTIEDSEALLCRVEYNAELFESTAIRRLLGHFATLLGEVVSNPRRRLSRLTLLRAAERHQLQVERNATRTGFPREATVCELFEAQSEHTPEAVAVRYGEETLSYQELERRANQLANYLRSLEVGLGESSAEVLVGCCLEPCVEWVVALLGILKAGGAYLALDPANPPERLAFLLEDARAPIVLTHRSTRERLPAGSPCHAVRLDEDWPVVSRQSPERPPRLVGGGHRLAYVIHTSGSTGQPKGVGVTHRAIARLVRDTDYVCITPRQRIAQASNVAFDAATFEIWGALLNGATLVGIPKEVVLSPPEMVRELRRLRIDTLFLTTSLFNQLAREVPDAFLDVENLLVGGEALDLKWVREVLSHGPPKRLLNAYGPTETTTFAAWHRVVKVAPTAVTIPIGSPIANTTLQVLDRRFQPVPVGVEGELFIGGEGLARGYFRRPGLTAERFVPDPYGGQPGERLYRTGDRVRSAPSGDVEFVGRTDEQVKLRGFRVEPGEIVAVLEAHPAVQEAIVLVHHHPSRGKYLAAYVVAPGSSDAFAGELDGYLRDRLPKYMVPSVLVPLETLPLTPNGKVDRKALNALAVTRSEQLSAREDTTAPRTPREELLAGIWAEVLGLEQVGVEEDFFALGGHSLLATQVLSQVRRLCGVEVPLRALFEAPTVAELARHIERTASAKTLPEITPLARGQEELPLSFAQERLWFLDRLTPESPFYNSPVVWRLLGRLDIGALQRSLNQVIRRHEVMRTTFPVSEGRPRQLIHPFSDHTMPVVDLRGLGSGRAAEARRRLAEEARRPFDLLRGPVLRMLLVCVDQDEALLLVNLHHIATDGWSRGVLLHDLATFYDAFSRGSSRVPEELEIQYADFAIWQRQWLQGEVLESQLAYWREQLAHLPLLRLPTDRPRPRVQSYRGARQTLDVAAPLSNSLERLALANRSSVYMTLLAAFMVLLHRLSGQDDVVVGSPIANRTLKEVEGLIGFFANTLVMRGDLSGNPGFTELLSRIREIALQAYAHQDLPFEKLVGELQPERDLSRNPLFQVAFALQNAPLAQVRLPGLALSQADLELDQVRFDLELHLWESEETGLHGELFYSTDLFDSTTVERLLGRFERLLGAIVARPETPIRELPLLTEADEAELRSTPLSNEPASWWQARPDGRRSEIRPREPAVAARRVEIVDTAGQPVPLGVVGEIHLDSEPLGDFGRRHRDGTLEVTGYRDGTSWYRGTRVSLRAVEEILTAQPEVEDAVVRGRLGAVGENELVAYVVPAGSFSERLMAELEQRLPPALRPTVWVPVAALPVLPNGHLDLTALDRLEVIETDRIDEIEHHSSLLPGVDAAAVLVREVSLPRSVLHFSAALAQEQGTAEAAAAPGEAEQKPARPAAAPIALAHGPQLPEEPDAPRVLAEALERAARLHPQHGVVYLGNEGEVEHRQSYPELLAQAERMVGGLREKGIQPGAKVIFQLERNEDFIPLFWACALGGWIPVPLSIAPQYHPDNSEVRKLANACRLLDDPLIVASRRLCEVIRSLADDFEMPGLRVMAVDALRDAPRDPRRHRGQVDDLALILLTSGSTGTPKGVMQSHRALLARSRAAICANGFTPEDVSFNWMPLEHVGGVVMFHLRDVVAMAQQIHAPNRTILNDPLKWIDCVDRFRVTATWSPNFAFGLVNELLEEGAGEGRTWDLRSLRFILNGGEAIVARTARRFLELLMPYGLPESAMHPAWGMSETCSGVVYSHRFSLATTHDHDRFVEVGAPVAGVSLRIADERDEELPEGGVGHIQIQGAPVTSGYFHQDELNREVFTRDGWFRTGDMGVLRDGHLTITGREKSAIIISGVNYSSHELESVVEQVGGVVPSFTAACAVRGTASQTDELAVFFHHPAFQNPDAEPQELREVLVGIRQALVGQTGVSPAHLIPVVPEEIPKTSIGKVQHKLLIQRFEEGDYDDVRQRIDLLSDRNTLPGWFFKRIWRPLRHRPGAVGAHAGSATSLVFADREGMAEHLLGGHSDRQVVWVETGSDFERTGLRYRINPADPEHYRLLFASLAASSITCSRILHLWTYDLPATDGHGAEDEARLFTETQERGLFSLMFLVQALPETPDLELTVVSSRAQAVSPSAAVDCNKAPLVGWLKPISQQLPWLSVRHLDVGGEDPAADAARVLAELETAPCEPEVAWRGNERLVPRLERFALAPAIDTERQESVGPVLRRGGFYLVTGGLGGIGTEIARFLLQRFEARLLIVGRGALPSAEPPAATRDADVFQAFESLKRCGGSVRYEAADVADETRLESWVVQCEQAWQQPLAGILHLAGVYHKRFGTEETRASVETVLRPKVAGTRSLHRLSQRRDGCWLVSFGSVAATFGGTQVSAYAAANRFLEAFTHQQSLSGEARSYCYSWGPWEDLGMNRGNPDQDLFLSRGFLSVTPKEGVGSLLYALRSAEPHLLIGLDAGNPAIRRHLDGEDPRLREMLLCFTGTADELPAPAVTDRFGTPLTVVPVRLPELPRAADGTIDRPALAVQLGEGSASAAKVGPRTPSEKKLAAVWQELLDVREVDVQDNFFLLGGHSLMATRVVSAIRRDLGVEIPLASIFENPTLAGLASLLEQALDEQPPATDPTSEAAVQGRYRVPPIHPVPRQPGGAELPLSFAQQRLWFLDRLTPENPFYISPMVWTIRGPLDAGALERSLREILRRHETLRTVYPERAGRPCQWIHPTLDFHLPRIDLRGLDPARRQAEAVRLAAEEAQRSFDLARGPMLRAALLALGPDQAELFVTLHHIAWDGWSLGVLQQDMGTLYDAFAAGRPSPLPPLGIQYADFAAWQRQWLEGPVLEELLSFWRRELEGVTALELPTDRPRPAIQTFRGDDEDFHLSADLVRALEDLSQDHGATLFMTLLSGFKALLRRLTGQSDLVVGSPIANRHHVEVEDVIGFFSNTLAMRSHPRDEGTFAQFLDEVRAMALRVYAQQDLPFEKLVEHLQPDRDLSRNPVFQVMFVVQNAPIPDMELSGLEVRRLPFRVRTTRFDLEVHVWSDPDGLRAVFYYDRDLFDRTRIRRMGRQFQALLAGVAQDPHRRLPTLPLLSEAESHQLFVEWNDTATPVSTASIPELFEARAQRCPDEIALISGDVALSYGELNRQANRLAHLLRSFGVGPDVVVGLCAERGPGALLGVLATLKAGGASLALDPAYPRERLSFMLKDARAAVLLTQHRLAGILPQLTMPVVHLDALHETTQELPTSNPTAMAGADNLAYLIYTSGSTGRPKGVAMPHHVLVNLIEWQLRSSATGMGTRTLQFTSLSFDVSFQEIFATWCAGGTLVLLSEEQRRDTQALLELLARERVERLFLPFVALHHLAAEAKARGDLTFALREVVTAGEQLRTTDEITAFFERLPDGCLFNHYGPAEAHVVTSHRLPEAVALWPSLPSIGRPIDGAHIHLLDTSGRPVALGVVGEICIGGMSLARGYHDRPGWTAKRFVPDPFGDAAGGRLYRTGDLGRHLPEGEIEFLGRNDTQIKIRGYRVEPGEVEALLSRHPGVAEAVVMAQRDLTGGFRLVAWVVPEEQPLSTPQMRQFLQDRLPEYMVPATFIQLEALPLTPSGKIDRLSLPAPDWSKAETDQEFAAPRTPIEEMLAAIWAEVLQLERVGIRDHFFELGGHSLLATQVLSRVRESMAVDLPVRMLFDRPNVAELAKAVETAQRGAEIPPIRPVPRDGRPLPVSFTQQRLWFLDQLTSGSAFYNIPAAFRLSGRLDTASLERSFNEIVRRHESLRTTFAMVHGEPMQVVAAELTVPLPVVDLSGLPADVREDVARRLGFAVAHQAFDLSRGPLLRTVLVRRHETEHEFLLTLHHIVSDGWSVGVLFRELGALYRAFISGAPARLAELPVQFPDYAVWQRELLAGKLQEEQLGFWRRQLGDLPMLQLPTDRPRPAVERFRGAICVHPFPGSLTAKLKVFSQHQGCTLYMTVLAGFATLLYRYSGQLDVVLGTTIANRHRLEVEKLIGFFANTLVLRNDLSGDPTFPELVARVREVTLASYAHQDMPFEMIVGKIQPDRNLGHNPLFQVMLTFLNVPLEPLELRDLKIEPIDAHGGLSKFDLLCIVDATSSELTAKVEYNTDLFDPSTLSRMLRHFESLLDGLVSRGDRRLDEPSFVSASERHQLLVEWNDTSQEVPATHLPALFAAQVARAPDSPAVIFRDESMSYRELDRRSNQLARYLRRLGVGPEVTVGVAVERSFEMIVGLWGILKAGAAYVPLDPGYPQPRLAFMLEDSQVPVALTQERLTSKLPVSQARWVRLDADEELIAAESEDALSVEIHPESQAYTIYTSGSTGRPKGATISHRAIVNRLLWMQQAYRLSRQDRVLQKTPFSFDVSVWELFWPFFTGATLVMAEPGGHRDSAYLVRLIRQQEITVLHFVPSMLQLFLEERDVELCTSLREVICSGEALATELKERFFQRLGARLENLYGPTEAAVDVTFHPCKPGARVPIGRPIHNLGIYLLDRRLRGVPLGVAGELHIGGAGVGRGYLGRPALTAERFIPDPFAEAPGSRLYKTGDLTRHLPDGSVEFLGRIDHQVKVRGFRIEVGEIEETLGQHPAVRETVVTVQGSDASGARLVAYVVPMNEVREGAEGSQEEQVTEWESVYDEIYGQPQVDADPTFNTVGWNSSYSGEPIPQEEMRSWLDQTVERILERQPRRALEIGAGSGLVLFRVASHCQEYRATDISSASVSYLEKQVRRQGFSLPHVSVAQRQADDFEDVSPGSFDAVLLNSVVQYFPGSEYLREVLEGAVTATADGGFVFLGDIRSRPLLEAFHASVLLFQGAATSGVEQLQHQWLRRVAQEQELVVEPAFFLALKRLLPRVSRVEVHLKKGRYRNELTRYRYDVLLHVGDSAAPWIEPPRIDWGEPRTSLEEIGRRLAADDLDSLIVQRVPNARVAEEVELVRQLAANADLPAQIGELRQMLAAEVDGAGVDPEDFRDLGAAAGYRVDVTVSPLPGGGHFDVLFRRQPHATWDLASFGGWDTLAAQPLSAQTNNPLQGRLAAGLLTQLRGFVQERLPDYMTPAAFMVLGSLPLTPNGKVDRRALPKPDWLRPEASERYVAPQTPVEKILARIWAEVLGVEQVGAHDNFFALGGDSILSIRVIARAAEESIELVPKQFFEQQNLTELAAVAKVLPGAFDVTAPVPLTPSQHRFLAQDSGGVGSAATLSMEAAEPLEAALVEQAWEAVRRHHGALSLRFERRRDGWHQLDAVQRPSFQRLTLPDLGPEERERTLAEVTEELCRSLDLGSAPLARLTLCELGARQHLILAAHPLVADADSWRLLVENLESAYLSLQRGEAPTLPPETTSFQHWARQLEARRQSWDPEGELDYWVHVQTAEASYLPVERGDGNGPSGAVRVELAPEETRRLLEEVPKAYQTRLSEVLLAALAEVLTAQTGKSSLQLQLQMPGRREILPETDVSGTVGSFASTFPCRLDLPSPADPGETLKAVKEQVRRIPFGGVGYGFLQEHGFDRERHEARPEREASPPIRFEWVDEHDLFASFRLLRPASAVDGFPRSPETRPGHRLEIRGGVRADRLILLWEYDPQCLERRSVERLAESFTESVRSLIAHCAAPHAGAATPMDFPLANLDQRQLDQVLAKLSGQ